MDNSQRNNLLSLTTFKPAYAPAGMLLVCLALAACSHASNRAEKNNRAAASPQTTPASPTPTPSPSPVVELLKIPERVASGAVTESGGGWNRAVQTIDYVSAADNTLTKIPKLLSGG